jgi:hypothetical protein
MQWTEETLIKVERMAGAAFTLEDIADVLELDIDLLYLAMDNREDPFRKAFRKGLLQRQLELRERIFKDAKHGSSPAQTIASKLLNDVIIKNYLR